MPGQPEDGLMFAEDRLLKIRSAEVFFQDPSEWSYCICAFGFLRPFGHAHNGLPTGRTAAMCDHLRLFVVVKEWYQVVPWTVHQDLRYGQCPGGSAISSQTVEALAAKVPIGSLPSNSLLGIFQALILMPFNQVVIQHIYCCYNLVYV